MQIMGITEGIDGIDAQGQLIHDMQDLVKVLTPPKTETLPQDVTAPVNTGDPANQGSVRHTTLD